MLTLFLLCRDRWSQAFWKSYFFSSWLLSLSLCGTRKTLVWQWELSTGSYESFPPVYYFMSMCLCLCMRMLVHVHLCGWLLGVCVCICGCVYVFEPALGWLFSAGSLAMPSHDMFHIQTDTYEHYCLYLLKIHTLIILDSRKIMNSDTSFLICKMWLKIDLIYLMDYIMLWSACVLLEIVTLL